MKFSQLIFPVAGMLAGMLAQADELLMKNGSRLIGTLVSAEDGMVLFDTPFAGEIRIRKGNIERITTDNPVTLLMDDGTAYRDRRIISTERGTTVMGEDTHPVFFLPAEIGFVNPHPWRLGEGYLWTGSAAVAVQFERGNSQTDQWNGTGVSVWRSLQDRYTLRGEFQTDEANSERSAENWRLGGKYDRFLSGNSNDYLGARLRFEHDRFADLDLRTIAGPHVGRQFFEASLLSLSGELGPVWVDERFDAAGHDDWPGLMWAFEAATDVVGFGTTLYARHDGILNIDKPEDTLLNTTLGIRLPVIFGVETGFEARWEYNGGAVENVDSLGETYNLRMGFAW
jgi:hypothetical protein